MSEANRVVHDESVRGETAYVYGFKARARDHHCMGWGTFSVELTGLEKLRKEYTRRVAPITYLPLYLKATALTVQRHPDANSVLFRKLLGLRIVRFAHVDVNLPITRSVNGRSMTFIGTIRDAANKTLAQIQREITAYQRCPPEQSFHIRRMLRFSRMPLWQAKAVHRWMTWSPEFYIKNVGSCGLTFAGGDWFEHGFPIGPTTAIFGIGGSHREPVVRGDEVGIARVLKCSLMVDNFVLSGLTGSLLIRDFKELLETASFVEEELAAAGELGG
jgi:pyruvate/2-oxoglutarate dehydrogenase complex dihydrolipoamide acyltransferase (E2) component